jgi:cell division protein FtsB
MTTNIETQMEPFAMAEKITRAEWIAIAALVISILGGSFSLGVVYADVQSQGRRLDAVEQSNSALVQKVERIDANVSFLAELAREERNRR